MLPAWLPCSLRQAPRLRPSPRCCWVVRVSRWGGSGGLAVDKAGIWIRLRQWAGWAGCACEQEEGMAPTGERGQWTGRCRGGASLPWGRTRNTATTCDSAPQRAVGPLRQRLMSFDIPALSLFGSRGLAVSLAHAWSDSIRTVIRWHTTTYIPEGPSASHLGQRKVDSEGRSRRHVGNPRNLY
jgi:hypothetical protein